MTARPVVVGVDGSAPSLAAAEYAAHVARGRGCPLRLLHGYLQLAYGYPTPLDHGTSVLGGYPPGYPDPKANAEAMLSSVTGPLRDRFPDLSIDPVALAEGGAAALIRASGEAEVVVVGCRGLGGFAQLLLGSVSSQVAAHAQGPVIVVRPSQAAPRAAAPVVVGVDGSPGAALAVEFAFAEAAARGAELVAMTVYWPDVPLHARRSSEEIEAEASQQAGELVTEATAACRAKYPELTVRAMVSRHLNVEYQMVEASRDAALVVVGARGRGGFAGLLLGSVSQALVHHAECPVAVVHPRKDGSGA